MKIIRDSTSCLLHLLLLAELLVHSSSRPVGGAQLCSHFKSMIHHVERVKHFSKMLHGLDEDELQKFAGVENRLNGLPQMQHSGDYFSSLKANQSLSQLYEYTQSFRQHVDWLKLKRNVTSSSQSASNASTHLSKLSKLINMSLQQISEEAPQVPPASFPDVPTDFEGLRFSVEISKRLQIFCDWSNRVLRQLRQTSGCPRH